MKTCILGYFGIEQVPSFLPVLLGANNIYKTEFCEKKRKRVKNRDFSFSL